MLIKKIYFLNFLVAVLGFFISFVLLQNYTHGDQIHYRSFYEKIAGLSLFDVPLVAQFAISSSEPVTWFVLWLGANLGIDKDVWISILNVILMVGLFSLLFVNKAPWYVIFLFFSNFYFLVLLTTAERLKISYIFLTYAFLFRSYARPLFLLLMPLSHLQSIIFLGGVVLASMHGQMRIFIQSFKITKILLLNSLFFLVISSILIFILKDGIISKLSAYANSFTWGEFINITVLFVVAVIATHNKLRMMLALLPMFFAIALVGGDRVNMVAVTLALGILLFEQRLKHPLVLLLLLYFSFKSIPFIANVFSYGDGFYAL